MLLLLVQFIKDEAPSSKDEATKVKSIKSALDS